jgi:hypothetical protein
MTAHEITTALGGAWHGSYGMAQCPSHDDGRTPGLKITDDARKDGPSENSRNGSRPASQNANRTPPEWPALTSRP